MKTNLLVYAGLGCAVALLSLIAFGFVVRTDFATAGKFLVSVSSIVAMFAVFFAAARTFAVGRLFLLCLFVAFGGVVAFELLAFTVFPGLAKDVEMFSAENFINASALFGLAFAALAVIMIAALEARRVVTVEG